MANIEDLIYRIKDQNPIENVISEYVRLKNSGRNFKGLCPFHDEKTPSFYVSSEKGFYHCFGCKASGDVIKFIQEIEHVDFWEAAEILASRSGIDISQYKGGHTGDYSKIVDANEKAMLFFNNRLKFNTEAYAYFEERGLSKKDIETFQLGYSDPSHTLMKHIKDKAYDVKDFIKAGLIIEGKVYRDRFNGRLMFPIVNHMGRIIGFGGRIMKGTGPKYINSSENEVYKKGNFLYGLNLSRTEIAQKGFCIITEGYMDFISMYRSGLRACAAQLGTACTIEQAKLIRKITEKVIIMYDSDTAGKEAALRSIPIMLQAGLAVDVFINDEYKDPDEIVKNVENADYDFISKNSVDFIEYAARHFALTQKDKILREKHLISYVSDAIRGITDNALKNAYSLEARNRLKISQVMFAEKRETRPVRIEKPVRKTGRDVYLDIIAMMIADSHHAKYVCQELEDDEFSDLTTKGVFTEICNSIDESREYNIDNFINNDNIKDLREYVLEKVMNYTENPPELKRINLVMAIARRSRIEKKIKELEERKSRTDDEEEKDRLNEVMTLLKKKLKKGRTDNE